MASAGSIPDSVVRVIAHRGARSLAPENTLAAASAAFRAGAHLWETDIQMTSDGHPVLFHDPTLGRCTDVRQKHRERSDQPVSRFTLKELQHLDAGSFYLQTDPFGQLADGKIPAQTAETYSGQRIPTLMQALEFTQRSRWQINIELKCFKGQASCFHLPDRVMQTLDLSAIDTGRVVISSFHHPWLDYLASKLPGIEIQALVGDDDQQNLDFKDFRFDTYNVNADMIREEDILELKRRHKRINLFTVNDPALFKRFAALGVDGIVTDFPQRFTGACWRPGLK